MRIISLSPSTTEIIFALGKGDDIVGNTYFCDYPTAAKKIRKVGSWTDIKLGIIKQLKPDIVFTSTVVQEKLKAALEIMGFPVVHYDPRTVTDIYRSILSIGKYLHVDDRAQGLVSQMKDEEQQLRANACQNKPVVYMEEWYDPPMVSGNWIPDIMRMTGCQCDWVQAGGISREVTTAELQAVNPEIILLSYCGFGDKSDVKHIYQRKGLEILKAVQSKHVYPVNELFFNRPGPRIMAAGNIILEIIRKASTS